jgi:hypothetical protein
MIKKGAIVAQATTAHIIHAPNVFVVCIRGFVFMESIKSDTLQLGREEYFDGKSMKNGMSISWIGVTTTLIDTAIVVIAGLNMEYKTTEVSARVANVERAGIGNIPPQNPTPRASPI